MSISIQMAKHFREVFFGGNWTSVNLKNTLEGITLEQASTRVNELHTIATLVFHIHYYVSAVIKVLEGGPLEAHDKFSFDLPVMNTEEDWNGLVKKVFEDAGHFATLIEQLPESRLLETMTEEKYGSFYRNIHGIIEHTHYHLGQIVLIKKLLNA